MTRYRPMKTAQTPEAAPPLSTITNRMKTLMRTMPSRMSKPPRGAKLCSPWSTPLKIGPQMSGRTHSMMMRTAARLWTPSAAETGPMKISPRPANTAQTNSVLRMSARQEPASWPAFSSLTAAADCWAKIACKAAAGTPPKTTDNPNSATKSLLSVFCM